MKVLFIMDPGNSEEKRSLRQDLQDALRQAFKKLQLFDALTLKEAEHYLRNHRAIDLIIVGSYGHQFIKRLREVYRGPIVAASNSSHFRNACQGAGYDGVASLDNFVTVVRTTMANQKSSR